MEQLQRRDNQNPGRMNLFDFQTYKVLLDYGHNPESARALTQLLPRLSLGEKLLYAMGQGVEPTSKLLSTVSHPFPVR